MTPAYILTALGSAVQPRIDACVFGDTEERAKAEALRIAVQLSKARYHYFSLYDISTEERRLVGIIRVETHDPIATFK